MKTPEEFFIGIGAIFGMAAMVATITETVKDSVYEYISQRREYKYKQQDPQLLLFPDLYKPSFIKILGQETRDIPKNWKQELKGAVKIFSLRKEKRLEDNLN